LHGLESSEWAEVRDGATCVARIRDARHNLPETQIFETTDSLDPVEDLSLVIRVSESGVSMIGGWPSGWKEGLGFDDEVFSEKLDLGVGSDGEEFECIVQKFNKEIQEFSCM
jgi:hypothetical protein